ncbi:hypothetical protein FHS29_006880 [Saccharothrix tamanrassetensis]|uniref:Uncharacterized protein n=1 Tax=Saccharothrix tamanrassetensis TaxID=1051531 RepID=A0A841CW60_9PSEU|nr:hypothetical protein [Saccharothrix tamanrassetensis]MBB5960257.1 hypothetical protein [Saccharothrix tamanrassetensis]
MTEAKSSGPSVVWEGPTDAPVVLVLDPSGAAPHGDLPATWRPLTEHLRIVWCRLPVTDEPLHEVESVLADLAGRDVHLVAGAAAGADVGDIANRYRDQVRSVQTFAAPLPLGHPDVVLAVLEKLLAQDVVTSDVGLDITRNDPPKSSLLGDAATALWQSVYQLSESLKRG